MSRWTNLAQIAQIPGLIQQELDRKTKQNAQEIADHLMGKHRGQSEESQQSEKTTSSGGTSSGSAMDDYMGKSGW